MIVSRRLGMTAVMLIAITSFAAADTLHSYCTGSTPACSDNGTVTPTLTNPPTFAFRASPGHANGDFYLVALVPDNQNTGFSLTLNGTNTGFSSVLGSLFSTTEWSSGKLSDYLNSEFSSFTPPSPIDAYLPTTQGVDAGAAGYFVYIFDFGSHDFNTQSDPTFSEAAGSIPIGSLFVALLTDAGTHDVNSATAQSGALFIGANPNPPPPPPVPEPASIALFGSGLIGVASMIRRKAKL